jgi:divalent metal cation (Fe/Co/Zn/Cd) transporter
MPEGRSVEQIAAAEGAEGVQAIEKLRVRRLKTESFVDLHVQAALRLPLRDAHILGGKVKGAIRSAVPHVAGVLVHMEPYQRGVSADEPSPSASRRASRRPPLRRQVAGYGRMRS